jgi:hypothetical protein
MTPEQTLLVMQWQIAATILMGLDYFISDSIREKANTYVKCYFEEMQQRVDRDVTKAVDKFKNEFPRVLISLIQIVIGIVIFFLGRYVGDDSLGFLILLLIAAAIFIISGFNFAFNTVFDLLQTLGIAAPFRFITTFLIGSPKGPIAALGFICLSVSFYLRYTYVSA